MLGLVAALEELDDSFAFPGDEAEEEDHQNRDGDDEAEIGAETGTEIVDEDDGGEAAESDEQHQLADGEFGEASDVADDVIGEAGEQEDGEENERGGFGVNNEVKLFDGGGREEFL